MLEDLRSRLHASFCLISSTLRQNLMAFSVKLLPQSDPSLILQTSQIYLWLRLGKWILMWRSNCHLVQFNRDLWKKLSIRQLQNNIFWEDAKLLLRYKNQPCATKFTKITFSVSYSHKNLRIWSCRHSGSAFDGSTWQNVILIWRKQPSKLVQ